MRRNFTVEETQAILDEHYPWALEAKTDKPKCAECGEEIDEAQGSYCDKCFHADAEGDEAFEEEEE